MAELYTYNSTHLTIVEDGSVKLGEKADHGEIGSGSLTLDNTAGTQSIVGHKTVAITQSACSVPRTWTGYVGPRTYRRGDDKTNPARLIEMSLLDLNARLAFKVIHGKTWKRPREGIDDRLTALLASTFLSGLVADLGFVDYPTDLLDENDYRGQFPVDVLRDMALVVGYNFFAYWNEATSSAGLWFRDSNASTAFSSTLRISDVATDVDSSTTFAGGSGATLTRDPSEVISRVLIPFGQGYVVRTRSATETTFAARDGVAPNASIKRWSKAASLGDSFLFRRRNEEDTITDSIELPDTHINLVRAGQRIQAKYAKFDTEGYGDFTWFRILETSKSPLVTEGSIYKCDLTLSPQEEGCSVLPTFVQYKYQDQTLMVHEPDFSEYFVLDAAPTAGNLLVLAVQSPFDTNASVAAAPDGWTWVVNNARTDSAGGGSYCNVFIKRCGGAADQTVSVQFSDTDGNRRVQFLEYAGLVNPVLYAAAGTNEESPPPGYTTVPATTYPAGPAAVFAITFLDDGPTGSDNLAVGGTGLTLRTPIAGGLHGNGEVGVADMLRDSTSGTTPLYPAAGGWRFTFTSNGDAMTVGFTVVGDNC